jgi:hypothetical protein
MSLIVISNNQLTSTVWFELITVSKLRIFERYLN